jgi:hypothetical protein
MVTKTVAARADYAMAALLQLVVKSALLLQLRSSSASMSI